MPHFKSIYHVFPLILLAFVTACSTNPATGRSQFTGLLPASQEASVGASEHQKIIKEFGVYNDPKIQNYVTQIGQKFVPYTERNDVQYTFTVLDSPIINAFALPGGYVYVTRGLLAWSNNEAQLAAVIAHEIGHITARHSAARYSSSVAAQIGLTVLGAVTNTPDVSRVAGVGANLALAQYSQSQEHEADSLGIRYLQRAGYDTRAMSEFLAQLKREQALDGRPYGPDFFASHPSTPARVQRSANEAAQKPVDNPRTAKIEYMRMIDGLPFGKIEKDKPVKRIRLITPKSGDSFESLAAQMTGIEPKQRQSYFLALNGLDSPKELDLGRLYKIIR